MAAGPGYLGLNGSKCLFWQMFSYVSLVQGLGRGNGPVEGQYINPADIGQKCCDAQDPGSGFGPK
jgi:hypothetical protein